MPWVIIVVGVIVVLVGVFAVFQGSLSGLNLGGLYDLDKIWTPEIFPNSGRLPMSSCVGGTFLRWHNPKYYATGDRFWQTFEDGPWKWEDRQRYAGQGDNCGHYFALTEAGARAEGAFYGMDFSNYRLLSADFEFDGILDLTYEENLVAVAKLAFSNWQDISARHFLVTILSFLTDSAKGGTPFTDFVGHWASREGYDGILFFGARAIDGVSGLREYINGGADEGMAGPVVHGYFTEMRQNNDVKNLAVFSGARLTMKVTATRLLPDAAVKNPYYGASDAEIETRLRYGAEYQEDQASNSFYCPTPFTIDRGRKAAV
jgi:hypothetical protein